MPTKTTHPPTREEIEARAAELNARLAKLREEARQEELAENQRRTRAVLDYDRQQAASYSRAALDAEVEQARADFDAAVSDTPLVRALANYMTALQHRRTGVYEHLSALGRLGQDVNYTAMPAAELGPVEDIVTGAVRRIVAERMDAEQAARTDQRETAIRTTTEEIR